jgi:hypothetical protein
MELNMPFPDAKEFPDAFGISPERQQQLSRHLDAMVQGYGQDPILIRVHHIMADIAAFCHNQEELLYCVILHMGWHQRRGHQLAPR